MRDKAEWRFFLAIVRGLGLPPGDYAVFGSGPVLAHGLVERAKSMGKVEMGTHDPFVRLDGGVEVFGGWMGMDADRIIDGAILIEGVPFARLEDVLAFKNALGRDKDLEHVRLIERHLAKE